MLQLAVGCQKYSAEMALVSLMSSNQSHITVLCIRQERMYQPNFTHSRKQGIAQQKKSYHFQPISTQSHAAHYYFQAKKIFPLLAV